MNNETNYNEGLIPPGPYCYVVDFTKEFTHDQEKVSIVCCPHKTTKEFGGVSIPWCSYLKAGGISNNNTEDDFARLVEYFGTEDNLFNFLSLDLLWDGCKECGINSNVELTKEKIIEWINKIN